MLHPNTEVKYLGPEIGQGVFATTRLPKGTITWAQDPLDQVIDLTKNREFRDYPPVLERYSFRDKRGNYVLCWDYSRYFNHHCDANCLSPGTNFEIAVRDIEAGEQLTNDYGSLNLEFVMECLCDSPNCRKKTRPEDFEALAPEWDKKLAGAFPLIDKVHQPLWSFVENQELVKACLEGKREIPSIRNHLYRPETDPRSLPGPQKEKAPY